MKSTTSPTSEAPPVISVADAEVLTVETPASSSTTATTVNEVVEAIAENDAPSTSAASSTTSTRKRGYKSLRIQPTRVKKVMQTDKETGRMTVSVPAALAATMERFVEMLVSRSYKATLAASAKTVQPSHMKAALESMDPFKFLLDDFEGVADCTNSENIVACLKSTPIEPDYGNMAVQLSNMPDAIRPKKKPHGLISVDPDLPSKRRARASQPAYARSGLAIVSNTPTAYDEQPLPPYEGQTFDDFEQLTSQQRIQMIISFYKSRRDAKHAQLQWRRIIRTEPIPSIKAIMSTVNLFESTGAVDGLPEKKGRKSFMGMGGGTQ